MTKSLSTKFVAVAMGVAIAFSVAFVNTAKAETDYAAIIAALQAQIQQLLAQIAAQGGNTGGTTGGTTTGGTCVPAQFTMTHQLGDRGGEVMEIQKFLNRDADTMVATAGAGSPGMETSYFGPATKAAVIKFQNKYAAEVLAPVGLSAGTGYWGASSRAKANTMEQARCAAANAGNTGNNGGNTGNTGDNGTTTQDQPSGDELTVSAASQPGNSVAPQGANNMPFTRFTLSGNAKVDEVVVKLTGAANYDDVSAVAIVDENGDAVTRYKSVSSSDKTVKFTKDFTVNGGGVYTIVANIANSADAGHVIAFELKSIKADKDVAGSLPIVGAQHTVLSGLNLGSATTTYQPVSDVELGDTEETIAKVKIVASKDDITLKKIVLTNEASSDKADLDKALKNVKAEYDNKEYSVTVSEDEIVVDMDDVVLKDGKTEYLEITADIVGEPNKNIALEVDTEASRVLTDAGYGANISNGSSNGNGDNVAITGKELTFEADSDFDNGQDVNPGEDGVVLGQFVLDQLADEDVTAEEFKVVVEYTGATSALTNPDADLENFALYRGSTKIADYGTVAFSHPTSTTAASTTVTFDDVVFTPGTDVVYKIKADINSDAVDGAVYEIKGIYVAGDVEDANGDDVESNATTSTDVELGHNVTVTTGDLSAKVTTDDINDDKAVVKNSGTKVTLAQLELEATDADLTLDKLAIAVTGTSSIKSDKLYLYVDGSAKGSETLSSAGTTTFDGIAEALAKDAEVTVEIKAILDTTGTVAITAATATAEYDNGDTVEKAVTSGFGTTTVADSLPEITEVSSEDVVLAHSLESDKQLIVFSVKALEDDVKISSSSAVTFKLDDPSSIELRNQQLKVYDKQSDVADATDDDALAIATSSNASTTGYMAFNFASGDITIEKGDTYYFVYEADVAITGGKSSGSAIVKLEDANDKIDFVEPASLDESLVIPDEMKVTISTSL